MWDKVIYYKRPNGERPARNWINDTRNANLLPSIDARIQRLNDEEFDNLLKTKMLAPIRGNDDDFYELRYQGKGKRWRIAFCYDRELDKFVLLLGWRKTQRKQPRDIEKARNLLHEYLQYRGG